MDPAPRPASRAVAGLLVGVALVGVAHLAWLAFGWGPTDARPLLANLLPIVVDALAAAVVLVAARAHPPGAMRRGWALVGAALVALLLGDATWAVLELALRAPPFPSVADVFYLSFVPLLAAGVLHLRGPRRREPGEAPSPRFTLDALTIVASAATIGWTVLVAGLLADGPPGLATWTALAYPLSDLALLGVLLLLALRGGPALPGWGWLCLALALNIVADLAFLALEAQDAYVAGHPIDALASAYVACLALAAWRGLGPPGTPDGRWRPALDAAQTYGPYVGLAATHLLLLGAHADGPRGRGALIGTTLVTGLVVLRQVLTLRDNARLAARLEAEGREKEALLQERARIALDLERQAREDDLTGLGNRRLALERLREEHARARDARAGLAVVLLDVDHFKRVNDTFGHDVGDAVLVELAALLRGVCRPEDLAARLGGEEFVLILPGVTPARAEEVAERVRRGVEAHDWARLAPALRVTLSAGVAAEASEGPAEALLSHADARLYAAKREGRNRVRA